MKAWIDKFVKYLEDKKYSENTLKNYHLLLTKVFKNNDDYESGMEEFFNGVGSDLEPATKNKYVAVLSTFQKFLLLDGLIEFSVDIKQKYSVRNNKVKVIETLSEMDIDKIRNMDDNDPNKLFCIILLETGIRSDEFKYFNNVTEWIGKHKMKIAGKSKNERYVPVTEEMNRLAKLFKNTKQLVPSSYNSKYNIMRQLEKELEIKGINQHMFRHTFATEWIYRGYNPYFLKEALGHDSFSTMEYYIAKNDKLILEEWSNFTSGKNNYDKKALIAENKYLKMEIKRLNKLMKEDVKDA